MTNGLLFLPRLVAAELERWALEEYPHEACGLLIGAPGPDRARVFHAVRARNLNRERPHDRYELDPRDFLAADEAARRDGLEILGVWHTHPDHPARPSRTDLEAAWEGYAYLILATTAEAVTELRSWRVSDGEFVEQSITERQA